MDAVEYYLKNREKIDFKYSEKYDIILQELKNLERIFLSKQTSLLEEYDETDNNNIDKLLDNEDIW
jgi:hypothetical protein